MVSFCWQKLTFWGLGGFLLILGGITSAIWPFVFNGQIRNRLVLSRNSQSFNLWKETPIPMYIDFYLFNWINPEETLFKKAIPKFEEKGPYVFSEQHEKIKVNWNENGTITFKQIRKWVFIPELSSGSLSDKITNVNVIAMTLGNLIKKHVPKTFFPVIDKLLTLEHKIYKESTVGELLFDGCTDIILDILNKLKVLEKIKMPFTKFGWFYGRNMSENYDGVFNIMTGDSSLGSLGLFKAWNYKSFTNYYPGKCGEVGGTTGELWPTDSAKKHTASIFATDLCSILDLTWNRDTNIFGASGSVFKGEENLFSNRTQCYCIDGICHPSGVREVSTCRYGAPAFISLPHFYQADPVFREMVAGMNPSPDRHTFDVTLHSVTGIPLGVNARLQINILIDKIPGLKMFQHAPKAYMPMVWFNERAAITPDLASQLSQIQIFTWFQTIFFAVTGLGAMLIIIGLCLWSNAALGRGNLADNEKTTGGWQLATKEWKQTHHPHDQTEVFGKGIGGAKPK